MPTAAQMLGKFVADLAFKDIPAPVVERANACIIDTVAVATFGSQAPWNVVADYAKRYGAGGNCSIIGHADTPVHAPYAALANGVFTHAFEHDSFREPSVGAHPGAGVVPALLAACEETGADGKTALRGFVAGCEVMFRVGEAIHHSNIPPESLGFHAPGLTGTFGATVAAGSVLGLNAEQMTHALGIAGSLSSGLMAFSKSRQGGMVKRLHFGRAGESGILAARLASAGYTGPETVLEGKFGFMEAYCREGDAARLTAGLNTDWLSLPIAMKRYAFHGAAQTPVQSLRELMAEHGFIAPDVVHIVVEGTDKLLSHHNIRDPGDLMQAQYSVPFCVALALYRDPDDPNSFNTSAVLDADIRSACRDLIELRELQGSGYTSRETVVTVSLKDGRKFSRKASSFKGMPSDPLNREELHKRFMTLTQAIGEKTAQRQFDHMDKLETQKRFSLHPA